MTNESINTLVSFVKENRDMKISQFFDILVDTDSFESNCDLIDFLIKRIYRKYDLDSMYGTIYEMFI